MMKLLAISGSLRVSSSNTALVRAVAELAPEGVEVTIYDGLSSLPPFNPDLDSEGVSDTVDEYRARLRGCDAVLISSPEYAHGIPGTLKNALDWVVGSGELVNKPVALINLSPLSTYAQAALRETLTVMSANVVAEASITAPVKRKPMDADGVLSDPDVSSALRDALGALKRAAESKQELYSR